MNEILLRKAEVELMQKWRKRARNIKAGSFEHPDALISQCIHELQETVIQASALPDEERWVNTLMKTASANANNTEENRRVVFRSLLRSYRWALLDVWSKRETDGQRV